MINGDWTWDGLGDTKLLGVLEDQAQTTEVKDLFKTDDFIDFCTWTRKWYQDGITMQDVLSNTQPFQTLIGNDLAIACFDTYAVNKVAGMIRTEVISAWAQANSYQALCYGININSKDPDAAWELMQVLYTDKDVCTLLADGIEGTHYVVNEDGTISFPEGKTAADCGYGMAEGYWIVPYSGNTYPLDVNGPTFFDDLIQFNKDTLKSKAFGFSFDITNVADQYTACSNIMDKYFKALISGRDVYKRQIPSPVAIDHRVTTLRNQCITIRILFMSFSQKIINFFHRQFLSIFYTKLCRNILINIQTNDVTEVS